MRQIKHATEYSKYGNHYFIAYDKKREQKILDEILRYTDNFVILETHRIELFESKNSFYFDYNDVKLDSLFIRYNIINISYAEQNKVDFKTAGTTNYIYFYKISDNLNVFKHNYVEKYDSCIAKNMIQNIPRHFVFDKIIINNIIFLKFSDKSPTNEYVKKLKFLFLIGGIGDFFITFSIVKEYLNNTNYENIYIVNFNIRKNSNFDYMVKLAYGSKVKLLNYYHYSDDFLNYWLAHEDSSLYHKTIDMFYLPKFKANHMAMLYKKVLIGERDLNYYKYNDILKGQILNKVSNEEKNYINSLVKNTAINIGLQYFSGVFNRDNKFISWGEKKWDEKNTNEFIKKCKDSNINLVVLNSESYSPHLKKFCTKKLSIAGYALLVSKMNLIVGVDSSATHIASFYNIPSITLWGKGSPLFLNYSDNINHIGFRALRKNYSIIARNKKLSSINHNIVFFLVKKFIKNELTFKDEIITYKDSINGYNMIYV